MLIIRQLLQDTLESIELLHKNDRNTQALILLYSGIDTLAWLGAPGDTTRTVFRQWVDQYLLPGTRLGCSSYDLYSARCGLLHTHAAESASTTTGSARQIWYWTGQQFQQLLQYEVGNRADVVLVRFSDLIVAFVQGAERFVGDLLQDAPRAARAQERLGSGWRGFLRLLRHNTHVRA